MKHSFGSPNLGDATSEYEGVIEEVLEEINKDLEELGPTILNRPIGSSKVSLAEQRDEWARMKDDPAAWVALIEERVQQVGLRQAIIDVTDYDKKMQAMK